MEISWRYFLVWNSIFCVASAGIFMLEGIDGQDMQLVPRRRRGFHLNLPFLATAISDGLEKVADVLTNPKPFKIEITAQHGSSPNYMYPQNPNQNVYQNQPMVYTIEKPGENPPFVYGPPHHHGPPGNQVPPPFQQGNQNHHNHGHGNQHERPPFVDFPGDKDIQNRPFIDIPGDRDIQNPHGTEYHQENPHENSMIHHSGDTHQNVPEFGDQPNYNQMGQNINLNDQRQPDLHQRDEDKIVGYIDEFPVILLNQNDIRR
ncbi:hypothetical protein JTB14_004373 [Gonioctena quinquepunctata]|nr:hypothetical protein JTB14_004373 [Gonioctena quinquepunctata]